MSNKYSVWHNPGDEQNWIYVMLGFFFVCDYEHNSAILYSPLF